MFAPQLNFLLMRRWRLNPPVKVERAFLWRTFWLTFLNFQLFTKLIADCHTSDSFRENIKQFIFRLEWRHSSNFLFFLSQIVFSSGNLFATATARTLLLKGEVDKKMVNLMESGSQWRAQLSPTTLLYFLSVWSRLSPKCYPRPPLKSNLNLYSVDILRWGKGLKKQKKWRKCCHFRKTAKPGEGGRGSRGVGQQAGQGLVKINLWFIFGYFDI